ncbi:MAG: Gldg family protein [Candidatus Riflebacteria bacterium]|nr:Gldg family protein [Candidatus Riflebacteria bacterium]
MASPQQAPGSTAWARRPREDEALYQLLLVPFGVLIIYAGVVLWALAPKGQGIWFFTCLGVGLLFLATALATRREGVGGLFHRTFNWSTAYGVNNWILILAVTGLVVIVNIISYRHSVKSDYTQQQLFSISPQTKSILAGLKETVEVTAFYPDVRGPSRDAQILTMYRRKVKELLDDYKRYSNGKLNFTMADPFRDPATAKRFSLQQNDWGAVFFESKGRKVKVNREKQFAPTNMWGGGASPFKGEEVFTGALLELSSGSQVVVYFVEGHNERQLDSGQPSGYNAVKALMERERYTVKKLQLMRDNIPADCSVLVIAGPTRGFAQQEIAKLKAYLDTPRKGALILLDSTPQPGLKDLLVQYGLEWGSNIVLEPNPEYAVMNSPVIFIATPTSHRISDELLRGKLDIVLSEATYVNKLAKPGDKFDFQSIIDTSPTAWAEFDVDALSKGRAKLDPATDKPGPLAMGWAVEIKQKPDQPKPEPDKKDEDKKDDPSKSRLVVIGDSDFASDNILMTFPGVGNRDLFMNSVAWLSFNAEQTATIRAKDETQPAVTISDENKARVLRGVVIAYPFFVLVVGVLVWFRRSNL